MDSVEVIDEVNALPVLHPAEATELHCVVCDCMDCTSVAWFPCLHLICNECMKEYVRSTICSGHSQLCCAVYKCNESMDQNLLVSFIRDSYTAEDVAQLMNKLDHFGVKNALVSNSEARWCPGGNCSYALLAAPSYVDCPKLTCELENCRTDFCYDCGGVWHPETKCEQLCLGTAMKTCPQCRTSIFKQGGCNLMTCPQCSTKFCWICCAIIDGWFHFTGPNGCPYYGGTRMNRKSKVCLQILICLLALPGIPVLAVGLCIYIVFAIPVRLIRSFLRQTEYTVPVQICVVILAAFGGVCFGLLCSFFVTLAFLFLISIFLCVFLPLSWFVDMRRLDADGVLKTRTKNAVSSARSMTHYSASKQLDGSTADPEDVVPDADASKSSFEVKIES